MQQAWASVAQRLMDAEDGWAGGIFDFEEENEE